MSEEVPVTSIQKLGIARQLLAEAKTLDDILHIRDIAEAARVYAQAAKLGLENQNEAAEVKIRAERKAGEMLAQMPKADEATRFGSNTMLLPQAPTLSDLGIEKMQSSRWQMVASLPVEVFEGHINETKADGRELTTAGLIKEAQKERREQMHEDKRTRPLPVGRYSVIYADPPWQYDNSGFETSAENHYPTMPLQDICNIPIEQLCDNTTVLFLWATNPLLPEALKVMEAWGFCYKTNLVWVKGTGQGIGWFTKSAHEILMIGVRENTPHPENRPTSYVEEKRTIHSRKPSCFYEIIESMYPGSKIELFARIARPGWDAWGNEEL